MPADPYVAVAAASDRLAEAADALADASRALASRPPCPPADLTLNAQALLPLLLPPLRTLCKRECTMRATELLEALNELTDAETRRHPLWPSNATSLGKWLNALQDALAERSCVVECFHQADGQHYRLS